MHFSIDWLNERLAAATDRRARHELIMMFVASSADFLAEDCYKLAQRLEKEAEEMNDRGLRVFARLYISMYKRMTGQHEEGINGFLEAEQALPELEPTFPTGMAMHMIAFEYWANGQRDKALKLAYEAHKLAAARGGEGLGWAYFQLAVFHFDMKDLDAAMDYFQKSKAEAERMGLHYQLARNYSGIGSIYIARNQLEEGIRYNQMAIDGYRQVGHKTAVSRALNDLGVIEFRRGNDAQAEAYLREALSVREQEHYAPGIITTRSELARVLMRQQRTVEARTLLESALALATTTRSKQKIMQCHTLLGDLCKMEQQPWQALEHFEQAAAVKAEIAGEEASNRITHLQQKHATERSEQEAEIHRLKNVELKKAYDQIEEKNRSILDSISYAQRIQYALLAHDSFLTENLPGHFIFFRPKDIVSGDFYWAARKGNSFFFATCDSTGHGVPGAFMSLLNSSFLNEAINEKNILEPHRVLDYVRERLVRSIGGDGQNDGMDCTLLRIDNGSSVITYAAAHNEPVLVRNGTLSVLDADKMPVGRSEKGRPFSAFTVTVQPGDTLYLFTDGYADQFGGEKGKKFKHKNLLRLLQHVSALPVERQKETLEQRHDEWKGSLEQLDDILVAGIRIN